MPREIVTISVMKAAPFEAASTVLAYIAYPDPDNRSQRDKFAAALVREMHIITGRLDNTWSHSPQQIRPYIFYDEAEVFQRTLRAGSRLLRPRITMAFLILYPNLSKLVACPMKVNGGEPELDRICLAYKDSRGLKGENISNEKSRVWGPTRTVCHLAFSVAIHMFNADHSMQTSLRPSLGFMLPSVAGLWGSLLLAEAVRELLPDIEHVHFKETDTIQFIGS